MTFIQISYDKIQPLVDLVELFNEHVRSVEDVDGQYLLSI